MRRWFVVLSVPVFWLVAAVILWPGPFEMFADPFAIGGLAFYAAGAVLIFKVPGNPIGLMLLAYSGLTAAGLVPDALAVIWGNEGLRADWADTIGVALATAAIMPLPLAMVHFPDGRLPSRRWRPVSWLILLGTVVGVAAAVLNGGWGGDPGTESPESPLRASTAPIGDLLSSAFFIMLPLCFALAGAVLIRRFVKARGLERNQIKLLAMAAVIVTLELVALTAMGVAAVDTSWGAILLAGGLALWPLAVAVAVLRYRLYEIDRIISRTVSYGLVSAVLIGVYLGAVFVLGRFLPSQDELAVAGSTLLAAALFNPLRRKIQQVVDRKFNRSRFDSERTMEALSRRLSNQLDLSDLGRELQQVAHLTMEPANVTVWVREIRR